MNQKVNIFDNDEGYQDQLRDAENMREEFNTLTRGDENQEF